MIKNYTNVEITKSCCLLIIRQIIVKLKRLISVDLKKLQESLFIDKNADF